MMLTTQMVSKCHQQILYMYDALQAYLLCICKGWLLDKV